MYSKVDMHAKPFISICTFNACILTFLGEQVGLVGSG